MSGQIPVQFLQKFINNKRRKFQSCVHTLNKQQTLGSTCARTKWRHTLNRRTTEKLNTVEVLQPYVVKGKQIGIFFSDTESPDLLCPLSEHFRKQPNNNLGKRHSLLRRYPTTELTKYDVSFECLRMVPDSTELIWELTPVVLLNAVIYKSFSS